MSSVKIVNLTKQFNNVNILENINLEINQGELITLLGKSGCGKSTTLKLITILMNYLEASNKELRLQGALQ